MIHADMKVASIAEKNTSIARIIKILFMVTSFIKKK